MARQASVEFSALVVHHGFRQAVSTVRNQPLMEAPGTSLLVNSRIPKHGEKKSCPVNSCSPGFHLKKHEKDRKFIISQPCVIVSLDPTWALSMSKDFRNPSQNLQPVDPSELAIACFAQGSGRAHGHRAHRLGKDSPQMGKFCSPKKKSGLDVFIVV